MAWQPNDDLLEGLRALLDERGRSGWRAQAACKGAPIELFFPRGEDPGKNRAATYDGAREVCRGCPVIFQCAEDATQVDDHYGFRGALTPRERQAIRAADRRYRATA